MGAPPTLYINKCTVYLSRLVVARSCAEALTPGPSPTLRGERGERRCLGRGERETLRGENHTPPLSFIPPSPLVGEGPGVRDAPTAG